MREDAAAVGFYFRTIGEANIFHVANAGLTNYASNATYSFLGGTAEVNATLFQNMPEFGALCYPDFVLATTKTGGQAATSSSVPGYPPSSSAFTNEPGGGGTFGGGQS